MNVIRTRPAILGALALALAATGCGSSDDGGAGDGIVERANQAMASTSFHGKGSTTAVAGGTQEIWSDPRQGFRPGSPSAPTNPSARFSAGTRTRS